MEHWIVWLGKNGLLSPSLTHTNGVCKEGKKTVLEMLLTSTVILQLDDNFHIELCIKISY